VHLETGHDVEAEVEADEPTNNPIDALPMEGNLAVS